MHYILRLLHKNRQDIWGTPIQATSFGNYHFQTMHQNRRQKILVHSQNDLAERLEWRLKVLSMPLTRCPGGSELGAA